MQKFGSNGDTAETFGTKNRYQKLATQQQG
jgi:hypothetical protein